MNTRGGGATWSVLGHGRVWKLVITTRWRQLKSNYNPKRGWILNFSQSFYFFGGVAWDLSASWRQASHVTSSEPVSALCCQAPRQLLKGFPVKSPFALVQTNTHRRLDVCWLIWFIISDVTVLFWPITSWRTNHSEEQRLDVRRTTRGARSFIYVRTMH